MFLRWEYKSGVSKILTHMRYWILTLADGLDLKHMDGLFAQTNMRWKKSSIGIFIIIRRSFAGRAKEFSGLYVARGT